MEILFRGKRIDNGEWVYGYLIYDEFYNTNVPYIGYLCLDGANIEEVISETVGQYTGLTDKNGTKIFEGDVVNFKTTAYYFKNCRIKYQSYYGRYCAIDNHGYEYPMDKIFEYEVIGNIHDNKLEDFQNNPELLNN